MGWRETCRWNRRCAYLVSFGPVEPSQASAIKSISTRKSRGSRATSTVDRAGGFEGKYRAYTSFIAEKSFISFRKTLTFTTRSNEEPAASRIALRFSNVRTVCFAVSPSIGLPVVGSNAVWPETKTKPLALIACEYGPIALGPFSVEMISLTTPSSRLHSSTCYRLQHSGIFL